MLISSKSQVVRYQSQETPVDEVLLKRIQQSKQDLVMTLICELLWKSEENSVNHSFSA